MIYPLVAIILLAWLVIDTKAIALEKDTGRDWRANRLEYQTLATQPSHTFECAKPGNSTWREILDPT